MCKKWLYRSLCILASLLIIIYPLRAQDSQDLGSINEARKMMQSGLISEQDIRMFMQSQGMSSQEISNALQLLQAENKSDAKDTYTESVHVKDAPGIVSNEINDIQSIPWPQEKIRPAEYKVYGLSFFAENAITFSPSIQIPVPDQYILGAGDEIVVTVWGQAEKEYRIVISREGVIQVPNIGPIRVGGRSLRDATRSIKKKFASIYADVPIQDQSAGTELAVSLGKLRTITVNVVGEVRVPGSYTMSSLSTLFHALYHAGGPDTLGSLRAIELIREGKKIATLDAYQYLVGKVNQTQNPILRDQDIVRIPPHLGRVQLTGAFKRPGYYEILPSMPMSELLYYAGGFTGNAYASQLNVLRNVNGQRGLFTVKQDVYDTFALQHGDKIQAFIIVENYLNRVRIEGAVLRAGEYEWHKKMTVSELIGLANGLQVGALTDHVTLKRKLPDYSYKSQLLDLGKILRQEAEDILLENEDILIVPHMQDIQSNPYILVIGAISRPGRYEYTENMTLSEAIIRAGGFLDRANASRIEIARRQTDDKHELPKTILVSLEGFSAEQQNTPHHLYPYDFVFVRENPTYDEQNFLLVSGEVVHPGLYPIQNEEERLSDIIERVGGVTNKAFLAGASLDRVQRDVEYYINQRVFSDTLRDETYENILFEKGFIRPRLKKYASPNANTVVSSPKLPTSKPERFPVGIQLEKALKHPNSRHNITLIGGDRLYVPRTLETVTMQSGVASPTSIVYQPNFSARQYVKASGGYTARAHRKKLYVRYPSGIISVKKKFLFLSFMPKVEPGSEIYIPTKPVRVKIALSEVLALTSSATTVFLLLFNTLTRP